MKTTTREEIEAKFSGRKMTKADLRDFLEENGPFQEVAHGRSRDHRSIRLWQGVGKETYRELIEAGLVLPCPVAAAGWEKIEKLRADLEKARDKWDARREEVDAATRPEIERLRDELGKALDRRAARLEEVNAPARLEKEKIKSEIDRVRALLLGCEETEAVK